MFLSKDFIFFRKKYNNFLFINQTQILLLKVELGMDELAV
jgi:predicted GNAT superfamily acetyltransferase